MTKTRNLSDLLDSNGDVKSTALDNVPASNDASALTTGTLPNDRLSAVPNSALANSSITINGTATALGGSIDVGDITGVTAGTGLTGGGTSGTVTLNTSQDISTSASPTFAGATISGNLSVTGNIAVGTNGVSFQDNEKALFGTSDDLQIYHDGTHSYIHDNGTGNLKLRATNFRVTNSADTETLISADDNGAVQLYYDNGVKLATASGGVTVTGAITATGDITAFYTSDETLKTNIANIENPMDKVAQINGVSYNWTEEAQAKYDHLNSDKEIGVIAQQVEKVLPEMVGTRDDGTKAVRYERMCALLIECVKDLQKQVDELKGK